MKFTPEQVELLADTDLLQTAEALLFVSELLHETHAALADDGKIGIVEGAKIALSISGTAVDAFRGIKEVPAELTLITASDVEILGGILFPAFADFPSQQRDQVNACIGLLVNLVHTVNAFRLAPRAHPVLEQPQQPSTPQDSQAGKALGS
jgi:hypothetical protein